MISPEQLCALLDYDPDTGGMVWKDRGPEQFSRSSDSLRWRRSFAGKAALTSLNGCGYRVGSVLGRRVRAHHVAWAIFHGEWPSMIDHINGDRADNRIANLRKASPSQNQRNAFMSSRNTSGFTGVSFDKKRKKWKAALSASGRYVYLGLFDRKEAAIEARRVGSVKYGFSTRHGEPKRGTS